MNSGQPVGIGQGHYLYVGSAMGRGGGLYLPRRLMRHVTRSDGLPPHECRGDLLAHFVQMRLTPSRLAPRTPKRLFWNIDHILDCRSGAVEDILYFRSERRLEFPIVQRIESWSNTHAPVPGLGAHDHRGHSHFLDLTGGSWEWSDCCQELVHLVAAM